MSAKGIIVSVLRPWVSSERESTTDPRMGGEIKLVTFDNKRHKIPKTTLILNPTCFFGHKNITTNYSVNFFIIGIIKFDFFSATNKISYKTT